MKCHSDFLNPSSQPPSSQRFEDGGNAAGTVSVSGGPAIFTVSVAATLSDGVVTAFLAGSVVTDLAGNSNAASTSSDNRVDLDAHQGPGGTPTQMPLSSGAGSLAAFLHSGDTDTYTFSLTEPRYATIFTSGSVDTLGQLRDSSDMLLNNPGTDDDAGAGTNFSIVSLLYAGTYTVAVSVKTGEGSYTVHVEATDGPILQPDLVTGGSGNGLYGTLSGQTLSLVSSKARTVIGSVILENDGEIADFFTLSGGPGNGLFRVTYSNPDDGNISASLISGVQQTNVLNPGDPPYRIVATVVPDKKRLYNKKRGYLRKSYSSGFRAVSEALGTRYDLGQINVQTK